MIAGIVIVLGIMTSAIRTFVLARSARDLLTSFTFRTIRRGFNFFAVRQTTYEGRDRVMALYAPVALIILPGVWWTCVLIGYILIYYALGAGSIYDSYMMSVSALTTLGFHREEGYVIDFFAFTEAIIGLNLIALLIAYLPTMYSAFSKREAAVTMLEVRADNPPSSAAMILRAYRIRGLESLHALWMDWEVWFTELEESHTSLPALVFFRSPQSGRSWVTAAGAVLDSAALYASTVDMPRAPEAELCMRAGYLALRAVADFFLMEYPKKVQKGDPISISQDEFDEVYDQLAAAGVPLKADRQQCWEDYAGWRVNYDVVLLKLAALTMAPYAPWVSDRSLPNMVNVGKASALAKKKITLKRNLPTPLLSGDALPQLIGATYQTKVVDLKPPVIDPTFAVATGEPATAARGNGHTAGQEALQL